MIDARNYSASDTLKDGTMVTVRPIRAEDRKALLAAFAALDRESIYTRFFTHKKELTDAELSQLTEVGFEHVVALVVATQSEDAEKLVGGGRYCSEQPLCVSRSAELAFMTADEQHGRGIASLILRHLVLIARDQGLPQLEADVLAHNRPMLAVFRHSGLAMTQRHEYGAVHVHLAILTVRMMAASHLNPDICCGGPTPPDWPMPHVRICIASAEWAMDGPNPEVQHPGSLAACLAITSTIDCSDSLAIDQGPPIV